MGRALLHPPDARRDTAEYVYMQYAVYVSVLCFLVLMVGGAVYLNEDDGARSALVHCFCTRCAANVQLRGDVSAGLVTVGTSRRHRRGLGGVPLRPLPMTADRTYVTNAYARALGVAPGSFLREAGTGNSVRATAAIALNRPCPCSLTLTCLHSPSPRQPIPDGLPQGMPPKHLALMTLTSRPDCHWNQTIRNVGIGTRGKGGLRGYHAVTPPFVLHSCTYNPDSPLGCRRPVVGGAGLHGRCVRGHG
jgi:hypothetical protein